MNSFKLMLGVNQDMSLFTRSKISDMALFFTIVILIQINLKGSLGVRV